MNSSLINYFLFNDKFHCRSVIYYFIDTRMRCEPRLQRERLEWTALKVILVEWLLNTNTHHPPHPNSRKSIESWVIGQANERASFKPNQPVCQARNVLSCRSFFRAKVFVVITFLQFFTIILVDLRNFTIRPKTNWLVGASVLTYTKLSLNISNILRSKIVNRWAVSGTGIKHDALCTVVLKNDCNLFQVVPDRTVFWVQS